MKLEETKNEISPQPSFGMKQEKQDNKINDELLGHDEYVEYYDEEDDEDDLKLVEEELNKIDKKHFRS